MEEIFNKLEVSFCYLKLHIAVLLCNVEPNLKIINFFVVPILTPTGQKLTFSREGGVEVVVKELATRMIAKVPAYIWANLMGKVD